MYDLNENEHEIEGEDEVTAEDTREWVSDQFERIYQSSYFALQCPAEGENAVECEPSSEALVSVTALRCRPEQYERHAREVSALEQQFSLVYVPRPRRETVTRTREPFEVIASTVVEVTERDSDIPF